MAEEPHQPPAQGTTYGRQKSKWGKSMSAQSGSNGPSPKLIGAVVFAVVLLVFILRNGRATTINFLFFSWDTTVRWSLFIAVLLGIALDRLLLWGLSRRKQRADTTDSNNDDESA